MADEGVGKALPVMYNIAYEEVSDLMDKLAQAEPETSRGANKNDAVLLKKLKRITMIHSDADDSVRSPVSGLCPRDGRIQQACASLALLVLLRTWLTILMPVADAGQASGNDWLCGFAAALADLREVRPGAQQPGQGLPRPQLAAGGEEVRPLDP